MDEPSIAPLVTIGMPVYNGATHIERALKALIQQTYKNLEIIVSDNKSSDATCQKVLEIAKTDSRIRLIKSESNIGIIGNFNKVVMNSKGEYFMWAAHDDEHGLEFVEKCLEVLQNNPDCVLSAPDMFMLDVNGIDFVWKATLRSFADKVKITERFRESLYNFPAVAMYGLYSKGAMIKAGLLPKAIGGDMLFIQRLSLQGEFRSASSTSFIRHGRKEWNTQKQDRVAFFGDSDGPNSNSIFLYNCLLQIKYLVQHKYNSFLQKSFLLFIYSKYIFRDFSTKVVIHVANVMNIHVNKSFVRYIYEKRLSNTNTTVIDEAIFYERIILPQVFRKQIKG